MDNCRELTNCTIMLKVIGNNYSGWHVVCPAEFEARLRDVRFACFADPCLPQAQQSRTAVWLAGWRKSQTARRRPLRLKKAHGGPPHRHYLPNLAAVLASLKQNVQSAGYRFRMNTTPS